MALSAQNPQPALDEPLIPEGYHKLAALMGKSRRMSIFRRFGKLTMVNLLDLQAELTDLEERYQVICAADNKSNDPTRTCLSKKFSALRDSETSDVKVNQRQRKMLLIIRKKLAAYHTAVLQTAELFKLDYAPSQQLNILHYWMDEQRQEEDKKLKDITDHGKENRSDSFLRGLEGGTWNDGPDLITLYDYKGLQDPTPTWITSAATSLGSYWSGKKPQQRDPECGVLMSAIDRRQMDRVGTIIAAILSSVLPLLAIMALYFVENTLKRLGVAIVLTTLFAAALTAFTAARRIEIFAATAAFAAVEVVFIGSVGRGGT